MRRITFIPFVAAIPVVIDVLRIRIVPVASVVRNKSLVTPEHPEYLL
jgi:hypothetical protein